MRNGTQVTIAEVKYHVMVKMSHNKHSRYFRAAICDTEPAAVAQIKQMLKHNCDRRDMKVVKIISQSIISSTIIARVNQNGPSANIQRLV